MPSIGSKQDLAAGFEPVSDQEWRAAAAPGGDPNADLETEIEPQIKVKWLYTPADRRAPDPAGLPGHSPFTRGWRAGRPWLIRQECRRPDRARANAEILEDLTGGAGGIELRLDRAARAAHDPASEEFIALRGRDGIAISTLDDLAAVLDGVYLDLAPIALAAEGAALPAAALLAALWRQNGVAPEQARGSLRLDPLATLAAAGRLARPPREELALAAAVAAEVDRAGYGAPAGADGDRAGGGAGEATATGRPTLTVLAVETAPYVNAGATASWELALALAGGVEYLRACEAAGLAPERAAARLEFTLTVGPDQFLELAKFRAIRRLWARVLESAGVAEQDRWSATF